MLGGEVGKMEKGREEAEGEEGERGEEVAQKINLKFIISIKFENFGCGWLAWNFFRLPA